MRTLKAITIAAVATLSLAAAPPSKAQSPDDLVMMQTFLSIMQDYFKIIESTHGIASDAEKSAIMQMQKIKEVYEELGKTADAVVVLREVLEKSRNPAIRNAAYIMLGDTLKETGRREEAVRLLRQGLEENIREAQ